LIVKYRHQSLRRISSIRPTFFTKKEKERKRRKERKGEKKVKNRKGKKKRVTRKVGAYGSFSFAGVSLHLQVDCTS